MEQSEVDKPVLTAFDKLSLLVIPQPAKTIIATTQPAGTTPVVLRNGNRRF